MVVEVDILAVTETWLEESIQDCEIFPPTYKIGTEEVVVYQYSCQIGLTINYVQTFVVVKLKLCGMSYFLEACADECSYMLCLMIGDDMISCADYVTCTNFLVAKTVDFDIHCFT